MNESTISIDYFLGAYWKARKESIDECAERLLLFFAALSTCEEILSTWYEKGRSQKQAMQKRVDIRSRDYMLNLLERGRHRRDIPRTVIEDLGFRIGVWNGADKIEKEAGLSITCGSYNPNPNLGNAVVLNLPRELGDLCQSKRMAAVLASAATAWEPAWAGIMNHNTVGARKFKGGGPFVDWMLYLSKNQVPQVPSLPQPANVQQVGKLGSIIVVQKEPPDPTNLEHLRNIEQVEAALKTCLPK